MGLQKGWWGVNRGLPAPAGLILGLQSGASAPEGWTTWSSADGYFLRGTDSDSLVGTSSSASSISYSSSSAGAHVGGSSWVSWYGQGSPVIANPNSPSHDSNSQGSHAHTIRVTHTPRSCRMKFVMAGAAAKIVAGLVGFATSDLPRHSAYTAFDGDSGVLQANSSTSIVGASTSDSVLSASDYHDHITGSTTNASGTTLSGYSGATARGGSHTHSLSVSATANLKKALVRAFAVLDTVNIEGLIGIWLGTGTLPTGWELATELTDYYLGFSSTGSGSHSGNNTVSLSGYTGYVAHGSHITGSPSPTYDAVSDIRHPESVSHRHSVNKTASLNINRHYIKFIRKTS